MFRRERETLQKLVLVPYRPFRNLSLGIGGVLLIIAAGLGGIYAGSRYSTSVTGATPDEVQRLRQTVRMYAEQSQAMRDEAAVAHHDREIVLAATEQLRRENKNLLETIAGLDEHDSTSSSEPVGSFTAAFEGSDVRGLRIGVPKEYFIDGMHPSVVASMEDVRARLRDGGAEIVEISLPHTEYTIPCYYVIATAEASSNLARFDGARYGYRSPNATTLDEMYEMSRSEGFGPEVKRRIMLGTFVLSSGYYDAYYRKAQQVRRLIHEDFARAFADVDLILTPTTPTPAFRLGEKASDPIAMYLSDIFTAAVNLAGTPAISIPSGRDAESGMPVGVQLIARHFDEVGMFRAAAWIERELGL